MPGSATWTVYGRDPLRGRTCRRVCSTYRTASPTGNTGQHRRFSQPRLSKAQATNPRTGNSQHRRQQVGALEDELLQAFNAGLMPGSWEQVERGPKTIAGIPKAQRRPRIIAFQEEFDYDEERDAYARVSKGLRRGGRHRRENLCGYRAREWHVTDADCNAPGRSRQHLRVGEQRRKPAGWQIMD